VTATAPSSKRRIYGPLVLTLSFLAIVVGLLAVGALAVRSMVAKSFEDAASVRAARILVSGMLSEQLDEETGVRGYIASHETILLQPYYEGRALLPVSLHRVKRALDSLRIPDASRALEDARQTNRRWLAEIAVPQVTHGRASRRQALRGKTLVDRFRIDMAIIEGALAARAAQASDFAQRAILLVGIFAAFAIAAVVVAAVLFTVQQYRLAVRLEQERARAEEGRRRSAEMRAAYEAEKRIADTLQEAFTQNLLPQLPAVRFSATYLPAAEAARIGGDWYDVLELSNDRVLIAIGDVTGHGIEAAVAMNKARHLLVACALVDAVPGPVLERVNSELFRHKAPVITAVAGLVEAASCRFSYAAAGHPPPVLLEPGRKARLLNVGSLPLGVAPDAAYRTQVVQSVPGALLVLYTDGAIEHTRNVVEGEALLLEAVESASQVPQSDAAAAILTRIFADRKIADDVAILTIRFGEGNSSSQARRIA
jgi:serine phosphatase RsbU (regulator of sigma subunit)